MTTPTVIDRLRDAFRRVKRDRPFIIDGMVVLPDHLHCIWRLPEADGDFATRWRLIKHHVSIAMRGTVKADSSRGRRREKPIWQRRFWEHLIRDETDWRRHMDYLHYNPVRHGYCDHPGEWPYSSFRRCVERGWYSLDWGLQMPAGIQDLSFE